MAFTKVALLAFFCAAAALAVVDARTAPPTEEPLKMLAPAVTEMSAVPYLSDSYVAITMSSKQQEEHNLGKLSMCKPCMNFASQMVGNLEKIALNTVVSGGCSALCSLLPQGNQICFVACEIVGVKEFINILREIQPFADPVYFCDKVKMCQETDNGAIADGSVVVNPGEANFGQRFAIDTTLDISADLGAGQLIVMLQPPGGKLPPLGMGVFEPGFKAGKIDLKIQPTVSQPQGQNTQPLPEGEYTIKVMICQHVCGSPYHNTELYGTYVGKVTLHNK